MTTTEPLAVLFVANKDGYGGVAVAPYSSLTTNVRGAQAISLGKTLLLPFENAIKKSNFDEKSTNAIIFSPDFKGKASETGLIYLVKYEDGFWGSSVSKHKANQINKDATDEIKKYVSEVAKLTQEKEIAQEIALSLPYYTTKYKTTQDQIIVYLYNDKGESYFYYEPYIEQFELMPFSTNCATIIGD